MTDEVASAFRPEEAAEQEGLLQFFQHAHHRVEGYLIDFREALDEGRVARDEFEQAVAALRQHMFAEEELAFPRLKMRFAGPIASLQEQHLRIVDLVNRVTELIETDAEHSALQRAVARLEGLLAAHNGEEDLGIYPDLVAMLSTAAAHTLLAEMEQAEPPAGWTPAGR